MANCEALSTVVLLTVTLTRPVEESDGTTATIWFSLQLVIAAGVPPLNRTTLLPGVAPKPPPVMVTDVPVGPVSGANSVTARLSVMLKPTPLLGRATALVATTFPESAPTGGWAVMLVSFQEVTTAATPLKVTLPCAEPNDEPAITTDVPGSPAFGLRLPIVGRSTVKGAPALCNPRLLTITLPLFAEAGTTTAILVSLQLLMLADCPLILTVPWFAPKLVPVTVIEVVGSALAGVRPVITGWSTLKPIALDGPVALVTTTGPEIAPSGTSQQCWYSTNL